LVVVSRNVIELDWAVNETGLVTVTQKKMYAALHQFRRQ
jgi:hypothetical protein